MSESPGYQGYGHGWITSRSDPRLWVLWPGGEDYGTMVEFPLWVAKVQCEKFAPALTDDDPVPENWVAAQIMQARSLVRAGIVGSGDMIGDDGLTVSVYPMDRTVKALLRPRRGRPYFGGGQR